MGGQRLRRLGHNYRRACEHGIPHPLVVHEHSNFSLALGLLATSLGMPYAPTRTLLGSDLPRTNPDVAVGEWEGEPVVRVRPIHPDVAVLHLQRASAEGFAHAWGNLGVAEAAALAAKSVIVCAEEVVPRAELVADPNRVLVPPNKVVAVVEVPGGAHPSPVPGYHDRDHDAFAAYHEASRTVEGFERWLDEWVLSKR